MTEPRLHGDDPHRIRRPVLMGVIPGQPLAVAHRAAELAHSLGVGLVCAYVDVTSYLVDEAPDGSVFSQPIDPDGVDDDLQDISASIKDRLSTALSPYGIRWSYRALAGEPVHALERLAHTLDASMIVVGTHERGIGHRLEEFLTGSLAVHLAHRQHRPVVVIPLNPEPLGSWG